MREDLEQTSLFKRRDSIFYGLVPDDKEIVAARQLAETADVLIVCSYNAWKNPSQSALIQSLLDTGKPVIVLVVRDSLDGDLFSPTAPSLQAAWDVLEKETKEPKEPQLSHNFYSG